MQGLEEAIKTLETQVKEEEKQEAEEPVEQEEPKVEEEVSEEVQEEEREEEEDEEVDPELLKKKGAWAKMRKDNKTLKEKIRELEPLVEKIKELETKIQQPKQEVVEKEVEVDQEPDKDFDREAWLEWKLSQQEKEIKSVKEVTEKAQKLTLVQAERQGVEKLENDYRKQDPEYDDVLSYIKDKEKRLIKMQYPHATEKQIEEHLENEKVELFKRVYNTSKGAQNPAEVLKKMAIEGYGYQPKKSQKTDKKVDFEALKRNQKKSLSLIGGSETASSKDKSPEGIFKMSLHQIMSKGDGYLTQLAAKAESDY